MVSKIAEIKENQLGRLSELGFRDLYGLTKKELADATPMPARGAKNPILVLPQIICIPRVRYTVVRLRDMAGLVSAGQHNLEVPDYHLDFKMVRNLIDTPRIPYWVYGVESYHYDPESEELDSDHPWDSYMNKLEREKKRFLTVEEGISWLAQNPSILQNLEATAGGDDQDYIIFLNTLQGPSRWALGVTAHLHADQSVKYAKSEFHAFQVLQSNCYTFVTCLKGR